MFRAAWPASGSLSSSCWIILLPRRVHRATIFYWRHYSVTHGAAGTMIIEQRTEGGVPCQRDREKSSDCCRATGRGRKREETGENERKRERMSGGERGKEEEPSGEEGNTCVVCVYWGACVTREDRLHRAKITLAADCTGPCPTLGSHGHSILFVPRSRPIWPPDATKIKFRATLSLLSSQ